MLKLETILKIIKASFVNTVLVFFALGWMMIFMSAKANTEQLDSLIEYILSWIIRVGIAIAVFGGIQTALGFKNDDADAKVRGLKTFVSGLMVSGIAATPSLIGW